MKIHFNSVEISMKCQFKFERNTNGISIKYQSKSIGNSVKINWKSRWFFNEIPKETHLKSSWNLIVISKKYKCKSILIQLKFHCIFYEISKKLP